MAREIRVSPDGDAVAIRSEWQGRSAWGIMHALQGGHWGSDEEVAEWQPVTQ